MLTELDGDARIVIDQHGGEAPGAAASISMLLQVRELGEFRGTEYGEDDRDPTSNWFGSIQRGLGGDKEAFQRFPTRNIGGFPGDHGGTVKRISTVAPWDRFQSAYRPRNGLILPLDV
jgi:hypothetical protein